MLTFIHVISISILIHIYKFQTITYDFKVSTSDDTFSLYQSLISTEMFCIGTPYQCIIAQFDPATSLIVIQDKNSQSNMSLRSDFTLYNSSESLTYTTRKRFQEIYLNQKMIEGTKSSDKMKFGQLEIDNSMFYLSTNWSSDLHYTSIGLSFNLDDDSFPNLIAKLERAGIITKHKFIIEFNDEYSGKIIFGTDMTLKKYTHSFTLHSSKYYVGLYFQCDNVMVIDKGMKLNKWYMYIMFDETFKYILMPADVFETIYNAYLSQMNCEKVIYTPERVYKERDYLYCICSKEDFYSQISSLSDLVFEYKEANITLKKEDLFQQYDESRMIFNIIFNQQSIDPQWIIGWPILKYFTIGRNFDSSDFTFYYSDRDRNDHSFTKSVMSIICILLLLGICFIGYISFTVKNKTYKDGLNIT